MGLNISQHVTSTEWWYIAIEGLGTPSIAELAFLAAGVDPTDPDYNTGEIITDDQSAEWAEGMDATERAANNPPKYFIRVDVGAVFAGNADPVTLAVGNYQTWYRLTIGQARPVRKADMATIFQEA